MAATGIATGFALSLLVLGLWSAVGGHVALGDPWLLLTSQLALWIGFVGAPVVASRRHGTGAVGRDFGLGWPTGREVLLGLAGGLVGRVVSLLVVLPYVLVAHDRAGSEPPTVLGTQPKGIDGWAVVVVLAVVGAPLVEELLFRGLIQGAFSRRIGAVPALFVTALIFAGVHTVNEGPIAPLLIFPSAVVLGWLRYRTGRLAAGMVAHATFNASLFVLLLVPGLS